MPSATPDSTVAKKDSDVSDSGLSDSGVSDSGLSDSGVSDTASCSSSTKGACGDKGQFCKAGTCSKCPAKKYNCDGVGDCESSTACGAISKCDKACTDAQESHCVKNPAQKNRCEECLTDKHCSINPRSNGPFCDTSNLAGTGFNFCICKSASDCAKSTVGKVCKAIAGVPNPKLKQCTCDTAKDCPSTHKICDGSVFKRCVKPCTSNSDCIKGAIQGTCDTKTGKCSYPSWP